MSTKPSLTLGVVWAATKDLAKTQSGLLRLERLIAT
jgi:hypothetical protein